MVGHIHVYVIDILMVPFMNFMHNSVNIADGCPINFHGSLILWITRIDSFGIDTMLKVNSIHGLTLFYVPLCGGNAYNYRPDSD